MGLEEGVDAAFDPGAFIRQMVRFEVELAHAQADLGLVPVAAALSIERVAASFRPDPAVLAGRGAEVGSIAIPLVAELVARVAAEYPDAARHVHAGTTSQDVLDTAMVLCTREALSYIDAVTAEALDAARRLAFGNARVPVLARTLLQPAGVTSLGLKAARWHDSLARCRRRLAAAAGPAMQVSLGGAFGTLDSLGDAGPSVRARLADRLGLGDDGRSWHTSREAWVGLAADAALLAGTAAKIARDVALMSQAEVGEVSEPSAAGRGGSSAMPQKRNPVLAMSVLSASQSLPGLLSNLLAGMVQEHERGLGNWQNELTQWPEVFRRTFVALRALGRLLDGLRVDADRCRMNIGSTLETVFSEAVAGLVAPVLGRSEAHSWLEALCAEALLRQERLSVLVARDLVADPRLAGMDPVALAACFDLDAVVERSARLIPALVRD
ncbi:MAG: lyase family protein [Betaproteobacteria bacterium]